MLLERPWLKLREDRVTLPGRIEAFDFHVVEMPEWVGILAVTEHEQVLFVEQYRHGCGRVSLELPAGVIDPGEHPLAAAQRELLEETGYAAEDWRPLIAAFARTEPLQYARPLLLRPRRTPSRRAAARYHRADPHRLRRHRGRERRDRLGPL